MIKSVTTCTRFSGYMFFYNATMLHWNANFDKAKSDWRYRDHRSCLWTKAPVAIQYGFRAGTRAIRYSAVDTSVGLNDS